MAARWTRGFGLQDASTSGSAVFTTFANGLYLIRIHAAVSLVINGFGAESQVQLAQTGIAVGIQTASQDGSNIQFPVSGSSNAAPPGRRWLWWRAVHFVPIGQPDGSGGQDITWRDDLPAVDIDIEAEAHASDASGGLAVYLAWQPISHLSTSAKHWIRWSHSSLTSG